MKKCNMGMIAFMVIVLALSGCKKDSSTGPGSTTQAGKLTDAERAAIVQSYKSISTSADSLLGTADPAAGFPLAMAKFRTDPNVDSVWISDQTLFVKFKKGGKASWLITNSVAVPPYDQSVGSVSRSRPARLAKVNELVGDSTALLINQQYDDEGRQYCRDLIDYLNTKFVENHYTVTVRNGTAANVAFFKSGLKGYGAIFYIAHGCSDGTHIWQLTGQAGTVDTLISNYFDDWLVDRLSVGTISLKKNGAKTTGRYIMFSEDFITNYYSASDFPHSLVYLVACQAFKGSTKVAQAFNAKGAAAVVGWDETNCLGQSTGKLLFTSMLGGATLSEAMTGLPAEAKLDKCEVPAGASLTYYPTSGGTVQLVKRPEAKIVIASPTPGQNYAERVQTLSGYLEHVKVLTGGTVEVGGVTTTLAYDPYGVTFSQDIVLKQGLNKIHVTCIAKDSTDQTVRADTIFSVTGEFPVLDLWTELRWNTASSDVDFHLLPPGSSTADLWGPNDCCYHYRTTSWGGNLDVDDVDGYGPEHITIPTVSTTGTYRLFVHYYSAHGAEGTSAYVTVSAKGAPDISFGPYALNNAGGDNHGDLWEVCTITYPAGTVTPVGQLTNLGKLAKGAPEPKKY